ncbi:hypothetical protein [Paenibacillus donghaensis]|uniref:Calcineurin-like phosphoesterase domain-containing protein n=1 Tax=Paenibacillus donghaensis TaxID=414771 RepID=A0A2Z2KNH1_9BACL|nr:hypothetical protein [Paenibacillus donghaensis]ASA22742.1 hypothetical protein B9T62_19235 [Paenibacillus donghaensis]
MTNELLKIGIQKRNKEISMSWQDIVDLHGNGKFRDGEDLRCWVKNQLRKNGALIRASNTKEKTLNPVEEIDPIKQYGEKMEIHKDGSHSSDKLLQMSAEQSKDVNYLLSAHGYDNSSWELLSARNNFWNVYSKVDGVQTLYSSKISVKPRTDSLSEEDLKLFFEDLSKNYQSPLHSPTNYSVDGKMLELNISDLHLGKLCWNGDSGDTYNYEIARERFFYIINDILTRTQGYKFEKILFIWSNDFFHTDGINGTTTAGTRQDTDVRWQQMYKLGVKMLVEGIDLCSQFAPVETCYIGSNHDKATSYYAVEYLDAWFRNNPNITVNNDAKSRKYVEFGQCLIGLSHGHSEGKRAGKLMPIEAREAWGRTKYHEFHAGHFHSEKAVVEENGIIVRYVSSPTSTDNWHFESGYVGAIQKSMSFVWDRNKGLMDVLNTTVESE